MVDNKCQIWYHNKCREKSYINITLEFMIYRTTNQFYKRKVTIMKIIAWKKDNGNGLKYYTISRTCPGPGAIKTIIDFNKKLLIVMVYRVWFRISTGKLFDSTTKNK